MARPSRSPSPSSLPSPATPPVAVEFPCRSIDEPFTILTKLKGVPSEVITTISRRLLQSLFCRHMEWLQSL